ncbi:HEAT repeat domain-containing protein [Streptomyces sp. HC44]|uniref:HEAT repeat domain-containing protein n=1 Tax=Streptomyces scabichelini TaxID=2711217 RepID=A0A6G4VEN7_9ACTN|nr:HEAT repeat domain-containing protein [Streptomyces scabichelini]NGO12365.1 HEAT repeat domain-containing protein [Streptomyces scabichelini]
MPTTDSPTEALADVRTDVRTGVPTDALADVRADALVHALGSEPRRPEAFRELLRHGHAAVPAIRRGLRHPHPRVREQCCNLLDHLVVAEAMDDLIAMLDDPVAQVRYATLHALSCDRCKTDTCRPDSAVVLPRGIRLLHHDPDAHVRSMAAELVGRWVHTHPEAADALTRTRDADPSPAVRKKASWYAPGGPIHRRTAPQPARRR